MPKPCKTKAAYLAGFSVQSSPSVRLRALLAVSAHHPAYGLLTHS